jgi:hypothetical protein
MKTLLRHVGAFLLGYLAAGVTYVVVPILLAYPTGMLSAHAGTSLVPILYALVVIASLAVWIGVYVHYVKRWAPQAAAPAPPVAPT